MSWLWNMILDLIIIGIAVALIYIVLDFEGLWSPICLGIVLAGYGWVHALLTFKRLT